MTQHTTFVVSPEDSGSSSVEGNSIGRDAAFQYEGLMTPVFAVDLVGNIVVWNKQLSSESGYSASDLLHSSCGTKIIDLLSPSSAKKWPDYVLQALKKGSDQVELSFKPNTTVQATSSSGRVYSAHMVSQTATTGEVVGVVCFLNFLHECSSLPGKNVRAGIIEQWIDSLEVPVVGVDKERREIRIWNHTMASFSGYARERSIGKGFLGEFVSPSWRNSFSGLLDDVFEGKASPTFELEFRTKSNQIRHLLCGLIPWRDDEGDVIGALMFAQDRTDAAVQDRRVASRANEIHQLFRTAACPIFGVDREFRINEWNEKMADITGLPERDVAGSKFTDEFVSENRRHAMNAFLENAMSGRSVTNVDVNIHTKAGEVVSLLLSVSPRWDSDSQVSGAVCFAQDVTESSKHDRAVAAMANELRQLIDTANAPIFGIDCEGDINEWNDKTAEVTGYSKEEAFDCSLVTTFISRQMQDSVRDILENAKQGRGTSNYELEFRTKSNEIRHLLVNATARRDAKNNVVGVVGVAQDVTEAVQRDRAVAGMAVELRQLIDTANAPIFGIDIDGNVNEWNRRTQEITGYSKEETFDEPLVESFIAGHMRQKVQEILDAALHGNETSNYELEFISKSGESRFMLVNATTRRDPESNVVGVVGVAQDVTEDRRHAAELRKMHYLQASQEGKVEQERNMTAYFAHELRNPLGAIDSALNSMPEELPEAAKSLVAGMQLCSSFMSSVMNNLLDVRKMEEGMLKLTRSPMSLERLLSNVHKMLLPSVKPGVDFIKQCDTHKRDWVLGDEHRIQQVLTNVITNAIKYTLTGSICLSIYWKEDSVCFECVDTGPGIPKGEQEKLFQRFVQRGGAPGTGLGLAIAKHIVNLTGGSIRFESDPTVKPGTTCIVEMSLPLYDQKEGTVVKDDSEKQDLFQEPLTFLIIDDVKMNRTMLMRRIKKGIAPNAVITEASTGEEALIICGQQKFDVIIVDQYMEEAGGVMVGTDVVYAMRRVLIDSIIIGCSGNDLDAEFSEAGADWVWQKPMPKNSTIIAHLREALARKQLGSFAP